MAGENPPPDNGREVLFLDRNMGSVQVAAALAPLWPCVEIHDAHFSVTTPDTEWLQEVGRRGWAYASKDKAIHRKPAELRALWQANVRAFTLRCKDCTGEMMSIAMKKATPKMREITAEYFDLHLRDKRFTEEHAREAGYMRRKGELQPRGSKAFHRSYTGQKLARKGHTRPLEFSGDTRRAMNASATYSSTSNGGRVKYSGAKNFNYRHPKSQIRMGEEFRRITDSESVELARVFDQQLDKYLAHLS